MDKPDDGGVNEAKEDHRPTSQFLAFRKQSHLWSSGEQGHCRMMTLDLVFMRTFQSGNKRKRKKRKKAAMDWKKAVDAGTRTHTKNFETDHPYRRDARATKKPFFFLSKKY
jgi:hypothetical protein